ncbi:hypothetical protein CLOM_g22921 [Closterium sp. NIES-68]|nr:hypothetical protein CLOM_g22921 [Closterium sp. NIES-68]
MAAASLLEEIADELQALEAVYGEDVHVQAENAENAGNAGNVGVRVSVALKPLTGEDATQQFVEATAVLLVTPQYPLSPAVLRLSAVKGMSDERVAELLALARAWLAEMLGPGEPMLLAACEQVKELLTEMNEPSGCCCFCLDPMSSGAAAAPHEPIDGPNSDTSSGGSGAPPLFKLAVCFHCFHSQCMSQWWQWELQQAKVNEAEMRRCNPHATIPKEGSYSMEAWWEWHGTDHPLLMALACRVLTQPVSASSCERNWAVWDTVHTARRNRLGSEKCKDLVYVAHNWKQSFSCPACRSTLAADDMSRLTTLLASSPPSAPASSPQPSTSLANEPRLSAAPPAAAEEVSEALGGEDQVERRKRFEAVWQRQQQRGGIIEPRSVLDGYADQHPGQQQQPTESLRVSEPPSGPASASRRADSTATAAAADAGDSAASVESIRAGAAGVAPPPTGASSGGLVLFPALRLDPSPPDCFSGNQPGDSAAPHSQTAACRGSGEHPGGGSGTTNKAPGRTCPASRSEGLALLE